MNRREFLGSTLGLLTISKIPFLAIEKQNKILINKSDFLFTKTDNELKNMLEGVIYAGNNEEIFPIQAPKINYVLRLIENDLANIQFYFEEVNMTSALIVKKASLALKEEKSIITTTDYQPQRSLINGDILKSCYTVAKSNLTKKEIEIFKTLMWEKELNVQNTK